MDWKPFDYRNYESGLFWLLTEAPGDTVRAAVLAFVEEDHEGRPAFGPVDPQNFGEVWDGDVVTHFAEVIAPAIPAK